MIRSRLLFFTISLFAWTLLAGCTTSEDAQMAAPEDTNGPVEINIQNNSAIAFDQVVVSFPSQREDYGAVDSGGESPYRTIEKAYRYAYIEAHAGDETHIVQPIDYVGETLLETGRYTYALDLVDGELRLKLIEQ